MIINLILDHPDKDILKIISKIDEMTNIFVLVNEITEVADDLKSERVIKAFSKNVEYKA